MTRMVWAVLVGAGLVSAAPRLAAAQGRFSDGVIRVGVMNDGTGPYADVSGEGSFVAAKMAVEEMGGKIGNVPIEVVYADHQNKPDVASVKAREWFDKGGVDAIVDLPTSSCTLAAMKIAKEAGKIVIVSGGGTSRVTNEDCNELTVHWAYDTYSLASGTARSVVKQGGDTWYFITADYAFGHSMEKAAFEFIKTSGGRVLGSTRYPFPASDFSSYLLAAQASRAKIIALANAGTDLINSIKQAAQFGISPGQRLVPFLIFINDVHSMGLQTAQGMFLTDGFYWDLDDQTRAWSKRYFERLKKMPNMIQAGVYSGVLHYLKAIQAVGTDEPKAVMAQMRKTPVNDMFARNARIREDGRLVKEMYLMEVKKPSESKGPWDYYHVRRVIPASEAVQPLEQSLCPLVKNG